MAALVAASLQMAVMAGDYAWHHLSDYAPAVTSVVGIAGTVEAIVAAQRLCARTVVAYIRPTVGTVDRRAGLWPRLSPVGRKREPPTTRVGQTAEETSETDTRSGWPVLTIDRVTKRFDGVVAVDDLSFTVAEGRIVGFLGPNGSGKTTTMRMVLDILRPDSGRILWRDAPIDERVRRRFGYLPEERGLYQKMRVGEQLLFFARLFGMERPRAESAIADWLERLGLADRARSRVQELSKGNQQKVQVIASLLHEPELALLDEPFSGLDPVNTELLVQALIELRDQGRTVVFSSHRLEQVEELCQDVAIIAEGHLRLAGNVDELRERGTRRVVLIRTASRDGLDTTGLPLEPLAPGHDHLRFALNEGADPQAVLATLADRERVELFALERPSLQEIFLEVTGDGAAREDTEPSKAPVGEDGPR